MPPKSGKFLQLKLPQPLALRLLPYLVHAELPLWIGQIFRHTHTHTHRRFRWGVQAAAEAAEAAEAAAVMMHSAHSMLSFAAI